MKNNTLETIFSRKSVRQYSKETVSNEAIETLIKAGMSAPSACDKRPWAFVAITDKNILTALSSAFVNGKMLPNASCAIVVCGDLLKTLEGIKSEYWIQDCTAAVENILIAVESLKLGAVWIGTYPVSERVEHTKKILNLPKNIIPLAILSIGYPKAKEKPKDKFDPSLIHWNSWGNKKKVLGSSR